MNSKVDIETREVNLLVEAIKVFSGYDLSGYAKSSLKRRVKAYIDSVGLKSISELIPLLAHNENYRQKLINDLTVNVSDLFRHPHSYLKMNELVFPYLSSFPRINIWVAGCASGEEVYSIAIILKEFGLLNRAKIYATDINTETLEQAKSGVLRKNLQREDAMRYQMSGGADSLSRYFSTGYGKQKLSQSLLDHIHFTSHNLVQDSVFCSCELVLCRNVMIYFDFDLQNRVLDLLFDSVVNNGYLVIGAKESLDTSRIFRSLKVIDDESRIYQRKAT
ncbi:CheR family methyltransferase [Aliikangiella coralliicola]|nr:protein-glutamate O-methyltransferase CheR [Aliikangiella coralliicola]